MKMMRKYHGGEPVRRGVYLNLATLELVPLYGDIRILPTDGGARYVKVPAPLVMIFGPFAGLVFAIFLPTVGILGMLGFLAYKAREWALGLGRALAKHGATTDEK
ncbi:MAG: hypothetical protein HYX79_04825 [Chloroflexi bacterium]|nr:hypothetical protein [Chloroflexota bacterium]